MQLLTADRGWVLDDKALLWTEDGGNQWVSITPTGLRVQKIRGAFFLDAQQGWLVASGPLDSSEAMPLIVYRTNDGGNSWLSSPLAPPDLYYTESAGGPAYLSFADERHGWAVVKLRTSSNFSDGHLFRTIDGGVTWSKLSIPLGDPVRFIDAKTGWVAGGPAGDQLYVTRNGGRTWRRRQVPVPRPFNSSHPVYHLPTFEGEIGVLPVTFAGTPSGVGFYLSRDNGATWTLDASIPIAQDLPFGVPVALDVVDATTLMVCGPDGMRTFKRPDEARAWEEVKSQGSSTSLVYVDFATAEVGWAIGQSGGCTGFKQDCAVVTQLLRTVDAGRTWTQLVR